MKKLTLLLVLLVAAFQANAVITSIVTETANTRVIDSHDGGAVYSTDGWLYLYANVANSGNTLKFWCTPGSSNRVPSAAVFDIAAFKTSLGGGISHMYVQNTGNYTVSVSDLVTEDASYGSGAATGYHKSIGTGQYQILSVGIWGNTTTPVNSVTKIGCVNSSGQLTGMQYQIPLSILATNLLPVNTATYSWTADPGTLPSSTIANGRRVLNFTRFSFDASGSLTTSISSSKPFVFTLFCENGINLNKLTFDVKAHTTANGGGKAVNVSLTDVKNGIAPMNLADYVPSDNQYAAIAAYGSSPITNLLYPHRYDVSLTTASPTPVNATFKVGCSAFNPTNTGISHTLTQVIFYLPL